MAISQEQVDAWFAANPNATAEDIAAAVQSIGGLSANEGLAGMIANRYSIAEPEVTNYYNAYVAPKTPVGTDTQTFTDNLLNKPTTQEELLSALAAPADNITSTGGVTKSAVKPTSGGVSNVVEGDDIDTQISQLPVEVSHWARSADQRYMELIDDKTGAVLDRRAVGDFSDVDLLKTGLSFIPGAGQILAGVNIADALRTGNLTGAAIGATGLIPGLQNVNTALRVGQAVDQNNLLGAITAAAGNTDLQNLVGLDTANVGGFTVKDATAAANLTKAAIDGNYGAVITNLGTLSNSPDTALAGRAITLLNRFNNGDTKALLDAVSLSNSISGNKPTTTGTNVADADVTLPTGVQLASLGDGVFRTDVGGTPIFAESKNASTVTAPFGYSLLSATEADNKPAGSYYDPTANAWFKPEAAVADLTGGSSLQSDLDLFTSSAGDLDKIAASTAGTSDDATADFLRSIGITNTTQLADSGLSNQDILDMINASTVTGATSNDNIDTLTVTGAKGNDTVTGVDTITGGDGNDLIVNDKGEVVIKDKKESCPIGTVLNPETGECDAVVETPKTITCPPGKVLNEAGTACVDEVIIKDKKDFCPVGTVLNPETGECDPIIENKKLECPEGYEPNDDNTACIPVIEIKDKKCNPGYVYDEDLKQCVPIETGCAPGYHDNGSGLCVPDDEPCADGYHKDESGACVPDECPEGYVRDLESGQCVPVEEPCKPGFHKDATGACVPDEEEPCKAGYHRNEKGVCVPDEEPCAEGYHLENGICVPDDEPCEDGYHRENGVCVPDECPEGYIRNLETGVCEKVEDKSCPPGQVKNAEGKCVPIVQPPPPPPPPPITCPTGYKLVNGACVPISKVVPTYTPSTAGGPGEKTEPIYAGGMDEFNLLATLQELLDEGSNKKDTNKSKEKTKMASGGHLDDLLAEQMTVDDLLKLLR